MTAWQDVERAEPEFAQRVRGLFDAHKHKTIATLRADGSPRISGIEAALDDGELAFGSMPNARKGADLRRDPRFALHSATVDPVEGSEAQWPGEAKISGRAIHAGPTTEGPEGDRFYADIAEVVHTHLNEEATNARRRVVDAHPRAAQDRARVVLDPYQSAARFDGRTDGRSLYAAGRSVVSPNFTPSLPSRARKNSPCAAAQASPHHDMNWRGQRARSAM